MPSSDLLLVAGEASGDLHGAALLKELARTTSMPHVFGLGGDRLRGVGMETVADFSELSVVGIGEVLRALPKARRVFDLLLAEVDRRRVELAVLIDFPEFNLRLARQLKRRGVKVVYYVSPQVWAWRRGRLRAIRKIVDSMMVFFRFEVDFYQGHVEVVHVGHPLVEEVPHLGQAWDVVPGGEIPREATIALLPGSRGSEIERLLPVLLGAAEQISRHLPARFVLVKAPSVPIHLLEEALSRHRLDVSIESEDRFQSIAQSHLALCASGTATLEVGLIGTPMIVVYKVGLATFLLGRLLLRVPRISLANLVLGESVVTELIQGDATSEAIAREAKTILTDRELVDRMRGRLVELRGRLGEEGASRRAAAHVAQKLTEIGANG